MPSESTRLKKNRLRIKIFDSVGEKNPIVKFTEAQAVSIVSVGSLT